jgi:hypothetical protein
MSDDQGWADVSYNTQTFNSTPVVRPRTPELDEMSSSPHTIVFTRFYAGSAVCSPTRASVLTGRTSERECIYGAGECDRAAPSCAAVPIVLHLSEATFVRRLRASTSMALCRSLSAPADDLHAGPRSRPEKLHDIVCWKVRVRYARAMTRLTGIPPTLWL